jgi:predicted transcriptional regulator
MSKWWYGDTMSETRTTVRLPEDLQKRLKEAAERNRRSVHAQILVCIERGLDASRPILEAHYSYESGKEQP